MADAELHLQLHGDSTPAVLGMIGRYSTDELDVLSWNCRSARPATREAALPIAKGLFAMCLNI